MKSLGVDATVLGSYTDEDLGSLTEAASQADVVFTIVRLELYNNILEFGRLTDATNSRLMPTTTPPRRPFWMD